MHKTAEQLKELLTNNGYEVTENSRSLVTECLSCGRSKHLYLFLETGYGKCMRCGTSFSPEAIVVHITGCTFQEARKVLGKVGRPVGEERERLPRLHQFPKDAEIKEVPEFTLPPDFLLLKERPDLAIAWQYLQKRGITEDVIRKYDLRYSPDMKRIVIPIYTGDKCVGWQGRDVTGRSSLPYLSPSGFSRASVVLGINRIETDYNFAILTEGPFDFLKVAALPNTLCSLGKQVTKDQISLIKGLTTVKRVYLALDPDACALFDQIASALEPSQEVFLMLPPEGKKDFGDCTLTEILEAFQNAKRYSRGMFLSPAILIKKKR